MTEIIRERATPTPELIEFHELITAADDAARYFGGKAFRTGMSDVAEGAYAIGSTFQYPPNKTTIHFMAERFRDEPGTPVNLSKYWLHLEVERTLMEGELTEDVRVEINDMLGDRTPFDPPLELQRVMNMRYIFDDDGGFEVFHDTFYRVDDQMGDAFKVHVDGEGIINISDEFGDTWEDISEYVEDEDEDPDEGISLGGVALLDNEAEESEGKLGDVDLTDDMFAYMVEGLVLSQEDLRAARMLVRCVRRRDIPNPIRASLGLETI